MATFITRAGVDFLREKIGDVDTQKANTVSLARSIPQQLQQTGLLQRFPDILTAATKVVQAAIKAKGSLAAAAAAAQAPAAAAVTAAIPTDSHRWAACTSVLAFAQHIISFHTTQSESLEVLPAAAGLVLACMRHMSTLLSPLPVQEATSSHYYAVAAAVLPLMINVAIFACAYGGELLTCTDICDILALYVFVLYMRACLRATGNTGTDDAAAAAGADAAAAMPVWGDQALFDWYVRWGQSPQQQQQQNQGQQGQQQQGQGQSAQFERSDVCQLLTGVNMQAAPSLAVYIDSGKVTQADAETAAANGALKALQRLMRVYAAEAGFDRLWVDPGSNRERWEPLQQRPPDTVDVPETVQARALQVLLLAQVVLCCVELQYNSSSTSSASAGSSGFGRKLHC